jgi:squalene synthase HpnC
MSSFAGELKRLGPEQTSGRQWSPAEARQYCRRLARTHYENFTVASWLVPKPLRQHFYHVYAYCRWADDLADEVDDRQRSLELLDWWETQLSECYAGRATHPVFVALRETIDQFSIPAEPFRNLLIAFRQDQQQMRFASFDDLLGYCRNSANPVGHLVLYLGKSFDTTNAALSDSICTGLQLANFWQDVARDWQLGRVYLPLEDCRRFGFAESMFAMEQTNEPFRQLLAFQVERAERYLLDGSPLIGRVRPPLRFDVRLFQLGGLAVLEEIRKTGFDVWRRRPTVGKLRKLRLMFDAWRYVRQTRSTLDDREGHG